MMETWTGLYYSYCIHYCIDTYHILHTPLKPCQAESLKYQTTTSRSTLTDQSASSSRRIQLRSQTMWVARIICHETVHYVLTRSFSLAVLLPLRVSQDKQGDPDKVTAEEEREGRRGRVSRTPVTQRSACTCTDSVAIQVPREPSGATGARSSSSISRSRSRQPRNALRDEGSGEARHASMSPSRAMGTRSVSIDRSGKPTQPVYRGLNTLEGIGSSVSPQVNPEAFDSGRGRSSSRNREAENTRFPVGSPTGARSVSATRQPSDFAESLNV